MDTLELFDHASTRESCESITCPFTTSADRKQNTQFNGSSIVICVSVASGMRVSQTVVQQRSIPPCLPDGHIPAFRRLITVLR
jgi:hypothetical protein